MERQGAAKRGGGWQRVEGDTADATQCAALRFETMTPDAAFDRQWGLAIMQRVLERLKAEHTRAGKAEAFAALIRELQFLHASQGHAAFLAET